MSIHSLKFTVCLQLKSASLLNLRRIYQNNVVSDACDGAPRDHTALLALESEIFEIPRNDKRQDPAAFQIDRKIANVAKTAPVTHRDNFLILQRVDCGKIVVTGILLFLLVFRKHVHNMMQIKPPLPSLMMRPSVSESFERASSDILEIH